MQDALSQQVVLQDYENLFKLKYLPHGELLIMNLTTEFRLKQIGMHPTGRVDFRHFSYVLYIAW